MTLAALSGVSVILFASHEAGAQPAPTSAPPIQVSIPQPSAGLSADRSAGDDATEIAKKTQNPVGDIISVPFTNYTNFNVGPNKGTQDILQIQPVIPIHVNEDWNVITRKFVPLATISAAGFCRGSLSVRGVYPAATMNVTLSRAGGG